MATICQLILKRACLNNSVMPPKNKKDDEPEIPKLGRFTTQLKVGIVGLPNIGKSSLFNTLTKSHVPAENYPFCTIDPHESRVAVPDKRFDFLVDYFKPANSVPAFLNVVDIAGLVSGASEGQGLGNAFLSNIKSCDAIFHVLRAFDDLEVTHVEGDVNPLRDILIINKELVLKDREYVKNRLEQMEKTVIRANDRSRFSEVECLKRVLSLLEEGKLVKNITDWSLKEIETLNQHLLLTAKQVIYLVNISEHDFCHKKNKWLVEIKKWIDTNDQGSMLIPFSATFEDKFSNMTSEEANKLFEEKKVTSVLPKIIQSGFQALQLEYFFTSGKDEVKAWTIQKGTRAPQAAGKIHTDFEKGFIMAEVMHFTDFKELGSEANAKAAGKYRQEGKQYVVKDGDIIFFKFNVTQAPKKKL